MSGENIAFDFLVLGLLIFVVGFYFFRRKKSNSLKITEPILPPWMEEAVNVLTAEIPEPDMGWFRKYPEGWVKISLDDAKDAVHIGEKE